eukprot:Em0001g2148a
MDTDTSSTSNVDVQGTVRGKCNKCSECKVFMVTSKGQIRCEYCDHTPTDHVRIIKLGACTSCNDCKEYMPESPTEYSDCQYCGCSSACHKGADELRKPKRPTTASTTATPNAMPSGNAKPAHLCIVPDCPYPKRTEGNKTHDFCSRTCAQKYQALQSQVGPMMMATGGGGAPAQYPGAPAQYPGPPTQYPGAPAQFSGSSAQLPTVSPAAKPSGYAKPAHLCIVPDCQFPKRTEGNKTHDFCSRTCAQKYQALQSQGQPVTATAQPPGSGASSVPAGPNGVPAGPTGSVAPQGCVKPPGT